MTDWISVKDEVPENDYHYLVAMDGRVEYMFYCDDGYWCRELGLVDVSDRITHWQPLPELPEAF